jgi:hypothetical protein
LAIQPNSPNLDLSQRHRRSGRKLEMTAQEKVVLEQFVNHYQISNSTLQKQAQPLAAENSRYS